MRIHQRLAIVLFNSVFSNSGGTLYSRVSLRQFGHQVFNGGVVGTAAADEDAISARVFFLFLTKDGVQRHDIWGTFLKDADAGRYSTFVHCSNWATCSKELEESNPMNASLVNTVPSVYCKDLVAPMVQLLKAAMIQSTTPHDKFVFLSDSTLPIKPFNLVYDELMATGSSDFCIEGSAHWPKVLFTNLVSARLVKHSQWVVLNRDHARILVRDWPLKSIHTGVEYWGVPLGPSTSPDGHGGAVPPFLSLAQISLCTDEWAVFASIFGAVGLDPGRHTSAHESIIPGLGAGPLKLDDGLEDSQGVCRTFVSWDGVKGATESSSKHLMRELRYDSPSTQLSCDPDCKGSHPETFTAISSNSLRKLRNSPFLFARKFHRNVPTLDEFRQIILANI